jgi:hypothetical protein
MLLKVMRIEAMILRELASKNLSKLMDFKVSFGELPYSLYYRGCPRNGK